MSDAADAEDLLYGVPAIAKAFGWGTRQTYHLKAAHGLPTFKIGRTVCAKRSAVRRWIAEIAEREAVARRAGTAA